MTEAKNYNSYLINIIEKQIERLGRKKFKILDFGAGSGTYADMLREGGIIADCLEPDKKLQRTLREKSYTVLADAKDVRPRSYDIIYAFNVMEHIKEDYKVFSQLAAALRNGGFIIIYVPAFQVLFSSMDTLVEHKRRYRKKRLRNMAKGSKLNVVNLHYVDPLGFGAALAYKLGGNKQGKISPKSVRAYDQLVFPISKFIQPLTKRVFGKNVILIAQKRAQ